MKTQTKQPNTSLGPKPTLWKSKSTNTGKPDPQPIKSSPASGTSKVPPCSSYHLKSHQPTRSILGAVRLPTYNPTISTKYTTRSIHRRNHNGNAFISFQTKCASTYTLDQRPLNNKSGEVLPGKQMHPCSITISPSRLSSISRRLCHSSCASSVVFQEVRRQ